MERFLPHQMTPAAGASMRRLTFTAGLVLGAVLLARWRDGSRATRQTRQAKPTPDTPIRQRITIRRQPEDVYRAWQAVEMLPRFMKLLSSITDHQHYSHWVGLTPGGRTIEWDMRVAEAREGQRLVWESLPDSPLAMRVTAELSRAPADRGTELTVVVAYSPSSALGRLAAVGARDELKEVLRRFRQWMEAGEVATIDGQPNGTLPETRRPELRGTGRRDRRRAADVVELASADSFPASDPPATREAT